MCLVNVTVLFKHECTALIVHLTFTDKFSELVFHYLYTMSGTETLSESYSVMTITESITVSCHMLLHNYNCIYSQSVQRPSKERKTEFLWLNKIKLETAFWNAVVCDVSWQVWQAVKKEVRCPHACEVLHLFRFYFQYWKKKTFINRMICILWYAVEVVYCLVW